MGKKCPNRILSISHCKNCCDSICLLHMVFHESEQPSSWVFCCMVICRKSPQSDQDLETDNLIAVSYSLYGIMSTQSFWKSIPKHLMKKTFGWKFVKCQPHPTQPNKTTNLLESTNEVRVIGFSLSDSLSKNKPVCGMACQ